MHTESLRRVALAFGTAWACWWVFFATAEAIAGHRFAGALVFSIAMFAAVVCAWKWPIVGAALFMAEGLVSILLYTEMWWRRFHLGGTLLMFAWMPLPPIIAGVLLLLWQRRARPRQRHPMAA